MFTYMGTKGFEKLDTFAAFVDLKLNSELIISHLLSFIDNTQKESSIRFTLSFCQYNEWNEPILDWLFFSILGIASIFFLSWVLSIGIAHQNKIGSKSSDAF